LAVIDTSPVGAQPITRDSVTLAFNGTLYNFREERALLEEKGIVFSGHSDAEVVLCMYLQYGEAFLPRLRGMYAFALWDSRARTLLCARDPLGIKPLLFSCRPEGFIFASEIKGLLASGIVPRAVNPTALYALLLRGSVPQQTHILQYARWLGPGDALTVRVGEDPQIRPFCRISPPTKSIRAPWPELVAEATRQVKLALHRQMRADVPVGAFLSGGIDSSLLVALMQQEYGQARTFSVGFESGLPQSPEDETSDAAAVASYLGAKHSTIILTRQDIHDSLPAIAAALDHPTVDGVNAYFVARAARQDITVAVSGTGGDELFAGYPWFSAMQQWSQKTLWYRLRDFFSPHRQKEDFCTVFDRQYAIFPPAHAEALLAKHWGRNLAYPVREDPYPNAEPLNRVTGLVLAGYTRDQLLADIDTATAWHGLEVRLPLLDEDLLRFALTLPQEAKIGQADPHALPGSYAYVGIKRILLAVGAHLLPKNFAFRAKRGFALPFDGWLHGALQTLMRDLLSPTTVGARGFFDQDAVNAVCLEYEAGRLPWAFPWLLMMTELWAQEVLDHSER
jgi:asparagine synthase (glutamine-hydrolysing)